MDDAMVLDGDSGVSWTPLPGGWSGESFLSVVGDQRQVVRIYAPTPGRRSDIAEVEAALSRLVTGLVPVPRVVEVRPERHGDPALLVTDHVVGVRGDDLVGPGDAAEVRARVGAALGTVAGRLAGMPTLVRGALAAPDLRVVPHEDRVELHELADRLVPGLRGWDAGLRDQLLDVCAEAQDRLDHVGRTAIVHGDLQPRNAVFGRDGELRAVVDWEHAHSGDPHADLGSLLRFAHDPLWEDAVLSAWVSERGGEQAEARDLARCADLGALIRLAGRPGGNLVVDLADVFLREIAASGDWHAFPAN